MQYDVLCRRSLLLSTTRCRLRLATRSYQTQHHRAFASRTEELSEDSTDPRAGALDRIIKDDYAYFREKYQTPQYPVVLAHGLMGFDELKLAGKYIPGIQYWRGIKDAMNANGIEVITTSVPSSGSIEERAEQLRHQITTKAAGKPVNIIAHSMGGLDSRYLISCLKPSEFAVKSLTTIGTPHRGSAFADFVFREIGEYSLPTIYKALAQLKIGSGAFRQLTQKYINEEFNPKTPNSSYVKYFSYGATFHPPWFSAFRFSHSMVEYYEGENDGLVSVASSKWGEYKGTLQGCSHLDLINWSNRLVYLFKTLTFQRRNFNAVAFYMDVADMLAKEGF